MNDKIPVFVFSAIFSIVFVFGVACTPQSVNAKDVSDITTFGRRCGTPDVKPDVAKHIQERIARLLPAHASSSEKPGQVSGFPSEDITVPVAFHVIHSGTEGVISESDITNQIDVMNDAYFGTGFQFVLTDVDYTDNAAWFTMAGNSDEMNAAKKALVIDSSRYLNLYSASLANGLLGIATFPYNRVEAPNIDGVFVLYSSLPGGASEQYDEGDTAVHEVGHWLGLYHTFQPSAWFMPGACWGQGDFVDDTPAERSPAYECTENRNTCLAKAGKDPIHNYMNYTPDACMYEFTPGQINRMKAMTVEYRSELLETTVTAPGGTSTTTTIASGGTSTTSTIAQGGTSTTSTITANPNQQLPVITSFTVDPTEGETYWTDFLFTCVAYDPNGEIVKYVYDLDGDNYIDYTDNETLSGMVECWYEEAGTYNAQVQVYDNNGLSSDIASVEVTVW